MEGSTGRERDQRNKGKPVGMMSYRKGSCGGEQGVLKGSVCEYRKGQGQIESNEVKGYEKQRTIQRRVKIIYIH